jgi:uncharacterized membrane protein
MAHWERSIQIQAPAEKVWSVMSDVAHWPEWTPSIESVEEVSADFGAGSSAAVKAQGVAKTTWRVTEWNPGHNFTWVTSVRGAKTVGEHVIEGAPGGPTTVRLGIEVQGLAGALFKPLIRKVIVRNLELESAGLKRRGES